MVGLTGFEPATPTTPRWCATKLRYSPTQLLNFQFLWAQLGIYIFVSHNVQNVRYSPLKSLFKEAFLINICNEQKLCLLQPFYAYLHVFCKLRQCR